MEIFFCSHCNQSIPLKDVQSGAAELRRGKYLCVSCKEIEDQAKKAAPSTVTLVLSILLAGSLLVIGFLLFEEELFPPSRAAPRDATALTSDKVLAAVEALRGQVEALSATSKQTVASAFDRMGQKLAETERTLTAAIARLERAESARPAPATAEDVYGVRNQIQGLVADLASIRTSLHAMESSVGKVERAMGEMNAAPAPPPVSRAEPPKPEVTEVDRWIAKLDDPVSGKRFSAVAELTRFKGDKVVIALTGRLKDEDFFIRRFVAEELGERKAVAALGDLAKALDDEEESVREAAVQALRKITGKSFGYKSRATARERARAKARWETHLASLEKKRK